MFRIILSILIFISILLFTYYTFWVIEIPERELEVYLISHSNLNELDISIKAAYESVLEEEGVNFRWITHGELWPSTPAKVLRKTNILIFPDYITSRIPYEFSVWIEDFIDLGGNVFIVYNCGTMSEQGGYREKAVFTRLLGMNYVTYNKYQSLAFQMANLRFKDQETIDLFEIPCGKYDDLLTITGYQYGRLKYPVAKVDVEFVDEKNIMAYSVYEDGRIAPNLFHKKVGKGNVFFANLPLGYLKAYGSDDLLLRVILRTFLFDISHFPHICNTPSNKGGIVLNWHVDDNREWKNIVEYDKKGFLRASLPASFHITAGDYVDTKEDQTGFDASKNPDLVRRMMEYGKIGSHGGWAHNWFAKKLMNNEFSDDEIEYYIDINNRVLSLITKYDIVEYAAPNGVHPQPKLTNILEKLGFTCYYYPGDLGSRPNRTFSQGKMVSEKVIAFPVMPFQNKVSVMEIGWDNVPAEDYERWLLESLEHVIRDRTIFLFYSHLYDFEVHPQYIKPFIKFLNKMEKLQKENLLIVKPMSDFAEFIQRFLHTKFRFVLKENILVAELKNPLGLDGISVAIPKNLSRRPGGTGFYIEEDENYFYLNITEKVYEKSIVCNLR